MSNVPKKRSRLIREYGDFQTPRSLAIEIVNLLKHMDIKPRSVVEPTCGKGSFIFAVLEAYPDTQIVAIDINPNYLEYLSSELKKLQYPHQVTVREADFFQHNWKSELESLVEPILIVGNPPWVTSSEIGFIGGSNLPRKENIYKFAGLDAKTGKSNFDISEWMTIELLEALDSYNSTIAMICKTSVAHKVLYYAAKKKLNVLSSRIHLIDANNYFHSAVDACLFVCRLKPNSHNYICQVYDDLGKGKTCSKEIGYIDDMIVFNLLNYQKLKHLLGSNLKSNNKYIWRSGIKHDCTKVMELIKSGDEFLNGLKVRVNLEDEYLYPMLKSSDLANNRITDTNRWMLVTQKFIREDTSIIKKNAPLTWNYLEQNAKYLNRRGSSIYKNRPKYSIFGVGDYAFAPWKIAISGFYKELNFRLIESLYSKPVVFDDTCYFLPTESFEEAVLLHTLLNHALTKEFFKAFIYWDAKRPITKQVLQRLDLNKLYHDIGRSNILDLVEKEHENVNDDNFEWALKYFAETTI